MTNTKTCCVAGCTRKHHACGYCSSHYGQIWRNGGTKTIRVRRPKAAVSLLTLEEEIRDNERALERANILYEHAIGLKRRIELRRIIKNLQVEEINLETRWRVSTNRGGSKCQSL